ncbi:MAG: NAD(P)/FAD-dependent oxidoreductase [Clostridia bacterium]|nr:NAD(P)/FAD-dependent oxidoreductase [Clostridia bacterium]
MSKYDVLIIGGATTGCYYARLLAKKGIKVKVIEAREKGKVGRFDIVHMRRDDFDTFNLPKVHEGDGIWAFAFEENYLASPSNKVHVYAPDPVVGMHMPEYIAKLTDWAEEAGAEFEFGASFDSFIFENGKIAGIKYKVGDEIKEDSAKIVVDASGMAAVGRLSLPADYGMETNKLGPNDMFYVMLRYYTLDDKEAKNMFWANYKTWIAPASNIPGQKIFGIGACQSFDYAEERYKYFEEGVADLPKGNLDRIEYGTTPYTRPPYTLVADNFIVSGDAGNLNKPLNGEGITSALVQIDVAADVIEKALKNNSFTKEDLWEINCEYNKRQGADFVFLRALMTKIVKAKDSEFEYIFGKLGTFLGQFMGTVQDGLKIGAKELFKVGGCIISGIFTGKLSMATIKAALSGLSSGNKLKKHYLNFPKDTESYDKWCKKADKLWNKVGKMT